MIFQLKRLRLGNTDTIGALFDGGCNWMAWTIEDTFREHKIDGKTCIPYGMYELTFHKSPKFSPIYGHDMIMLKDVDGFEYILIHPGNNNKDTQGCILVGDGVSPVRDIDNAIVNSRAAYDRIYKVIAEAMKKEVCHLNITGI